MLFPLFASHVVGAKARLFAQCTTVPTTVRNPAPRDHPSHYTFPTPPAPSARNLHEHALSPARLKINNRNFFEMATINRDIEPLPNLSSSGVPTPIVTLSGDEREKSMQ